MADRHHRYNTSEKGKERQRKYDRSWHARWLRRDRILRRRRVEILDALDEVQKELDELGKGT